MEGKLLALDVSTKTIGIALFNNDGTLWELTHITPKIKPQPKIKLQELFRKVDAFEKLIMRYMDLNISHVVIEEPLLGSNNIHTVATLLRFNGMIAKVTEEVLGVVPEFISSYDARAYAFPELLQKRTHNKKGEPYTIKEIEKLKPVLFGGYPYDVDKKQVIWDKVAELQPQIVWVYNKNQVLSKESYDMSDAYCVGLSWLKQNKVV
jgi:RNase H-fold protein (predicted Holliday junction resolvase)